MPSEARAPRAAAQVCAAETLPAELQWGGKGAESRAGRCENSFFFATKTHFFRNVANFGGLALGCIEADFWKY